MHALMHAASPNKRAGASRGIKREREREKQIFPFPPFAAIALRARLSEIARWLDYLDISSRAILSTFLSRSICLMHIHARYLCPLHPREASWTARRKLDAYYFTRCRRSFRLSEFSSLFFSLPPPNPPCIRLSLSLACLRALYFARTRLHALSNFPFLLPPSVFITFYRRRISRLF